MSRQDWTHQSRLEREARSMPLTGKTALVTGATSGIGKAIALAFAAAGADVLVHGRDTARASAVVERTTATEGKARAVTVDLGADPATVRDFAEGLGAVDILVNNAATLIPAQSMTEVTDQQISAALGVNVAAPIVLAGALVPGMKERGNGVIINIGSNTGIKGMAPAGLYGATKGALHALTRSWADELASAGIRVNAIAPGPTVTEDNIGYEEALIAIAQASPDRRPGTADEVARLAVFLAGPDAAHIHGAIIPIDGGSIAV
ncbi:SDR family NAD(P)-dependent oxidoreductase [Micromonospora sp. CA-263727]|uniref:SDR family NAD(P)-dependent oxidoreductase n=1 Tax=Micromonospora sp. CA-263727 TaxID=3239967 RepID=UPI003D90ABC5